MSGRGRRTGIGAVMAVAVVATLGGFTTIPAGSAAASAVPRHGFGAHRPAVHVAPPTVRALSALPAKIDLTPWHVPVGNQGAVGSCVTWAVDYGMLGWYARRDAKGGTPFAPMYTYSQINGGADNGSWPVDALEVARVQGSDTRAHYTQGDYDWRSRPTAAERANAANYKIRGYHVLFAGAGGFGRDGLGFGDPAVTALKTALASGHPASIGLVVRLGFYNVGTTRPVDNDTSTILPGYSRGNPPLHEVLALGYDATGLVIQNSWGSDWGDHGFARLSWAKVRADVDEAYTIDGFATLPPVAHVTKLSRAGGSTAGGATVVITGSALRGATAVIFGKTAAGHFTVEATGTRLTVTTPSHPTGTVDVAVWKGVRSSAHTAGDRFTYQAPGPAAPPRV